MNRLASLVSMIALIAGAPAAFAADLPSRYAPAPYYDAAPPIFTWTGLYAGLNGQLAFGSYSHGGNQQFGSPFGGLGGAQIGYNYQSGQLLVGVEADVGFGAIKGHGNFGTASTSSGEINGVGTLRARVGYIWNQRFLFYVTGGYAGTQLTGKIADFSAPPNYVLNEGHYLNGYAIGAGVEYAVTTKISIKGEYLFTGFGAKPFFTGTRDAISSGANLNLVRVGGNYHF